MLKVLYITRHPDLGFSIGKVFAPIIKSMNKKCDVFSISLPVPRATPIALYKNILFARKAVKEGDYDIVHITGDSHYLIPFLPHKHICCTVHDLGCITNGKTSIVKRAWNYLFWVYSLKYANSLTFISNKTLIETNGLIKLKNVKEVVIPNPVGPEFETNKDHVLNNPPVILHIGTLPHKNLINTAKALNGFNCVLRIIGSLTSEQKSALEENQIKYTVANNLLNEEVVNEYIKCDALNFPSLYEGFGMPIIEAQRVGRPVLTSNLSPMKEVAGEGAVLVDPHSPESIREGYNYLFNNIEDLVFKGLKNVEKYSLEIVVSEYYNLYCSMLLNEKKYDKQVSN